MAKKNKKPLTDKEFKYIYSKVPRLCVELIIKNSDGILLTLRKLPSWHNQWHIPGSSIHYGEAISEAIQRTAQDEIGSQGKVEK